MPSLRDTSITTNAVVCTRGCGSVTIWTELSSGFCHVKESTARELYERLKESCKLLSDATRTDVSPDEIFATGMKLMGIKPHPPVPPRLKKAAAKGGFLGALRALPEPSDEEKEGYLTCLGELPFLLRGAWLEAGKKLPHDRGGAPRAFKTPQEKKKVVEDLRRLLGLGVEKPDAISQVARKYDVSDRTIRRVWAEYAKANRQ